MSAHSKQHSKKSPKKLEQRRVRRGFQQTGKFVRSDIRKATESRGFSETRLLTGWAEIVGETLAAICRPMKIGYSKDGIGATLTILSNGANAPLLQAQSAQIRDKVNACYGYNAISRIRITQTAATGFSEAQAGFQNALKDQNSADKADNKSNASAEKSGDIVSDVSDETLRAALATLGGNILSRSEDG